MANDVCKIELFFPNRQPMGAVVKPERIVNDLPVKFRKYGGGGKSP